MDNYLEESKTLWMGDIDSSIDESLIAKSFSRYADVVNIKIIRDKQTQAPTGFGFIEFATRQQAFHVLSTFNNTPIPEIPGRLFKLNWAQGPIDKTNTQEFSIYVGDLAPDVSETQLLNIFVAKYPSVRGARVIADTNGASKGFGFIKFTNENEKDRALVEMQGYYISNKPVKLNNPTHKKAQAFMNLDPGQISTDPNNTAIYVSQLDPLIDEEVLRSSYGEITYIRMLANKCSAFVNYVQRQSAEAAFGLNNHPIGNTKIKIQWGKNTPPPQALQQPLNPNVPQSQQKSPQHYLVMDHQQQNVVEEDITKMYSIQEDNESFITWRSDEFIQNYHSRYSHFGFDNDELLSKQGPDSQTLEVPSQ
eukprot:gene4675-5841_t